MGRATNRIRQSAEDALRETVKGYQTVTTTNRQINKGTLEDRVSFLSEKNQS